MGPLPHKIAKNNNFALVQKNIAKQLFRRAGQPLCPANKASRLHRVKHRNGASKAPPPTELHHTTHRKQLFRRAGQPLCPANKSIPAYTEETLERGVEGAASYRITSHNPSQNNCSDEQGNCFALQIKASRLHRGQHHTNNFDPTRAGNRQRGIYKGEPPLYTLFLVRFFGVRQKNEQ